MSFKKGYVFLIFFNIATIIVAYLLISDQAKKHQVEVANMLAISQETQILKSKVIIKPELNVGAQAKLSSVPALKKTQIPIYSKADSSGQIFTTFKGRDELIIVRSDSEWAQVVSARGFPVWVRGDLVETFSKGYVRVVVDKANARTSPSVDNSISLGKLRRNDILKVNKKLGQWIRIWSPLKFTAWVKVSDFE